MKYILAFFDLIFFICTLPVWILRTLFTPNKKPSVAPESNRDIDKDVAAKHLSEAVRIPTISMTGPEYPPQPFYDYQAFLDRTYPNIVAHSEKTVINGFSLIYHVKGTEPDKQPIALLAHQDVVPVDAADWDESAPFSGEIKDGYIYGRGTQDMKGTMIAITEALETMLKNGFVPKRDIYLCFGHDEEPNTTEGAPKIVEYLHGLGVEFMSVLDEGGAIIDGNLLGVPANVCMIGTCEKGYMDVTITAKCNAGHASNPGKTTSVGMLSKGILTLLRHPMKMDWTPVVKETFGKLAAYMKFPFKLLFVNADVLRPLLNVVLSMIPITNALLRTTFAPTQLSASTATNTLSSEAHANINCRLISGNTCDQVIAHMNKVLKKVDKGLSAQKAIGNNPSPFCSYKTREYDLIEQAIARTFDQAVSAPFMFPAATDSRYYYPVSKNVYRFTPYIFTLEDQERIHGKNERCGIDALAQAIEFFMNYIEIASE